MAYTYRGTAIAGTETNPKTFPRSGIASARTGQTYFNVTSGHVYTCVASGAPSKATWRYTRTDITSVPKLSVAKLASPARTTVGTNSRIMRASWTLPAWLKDAKNGARATGIRITWVIGILGTAPIRISKTGDTSFVTADLNLVSFPIGRYTYSRASFYPFTSRKLTYVTAVVNGYNAKGAGKTASAIRRFSAPREPVIAPFSFNTETGALTTTITTNAGADYQERYDTKYKMIIRNTKTGEYRTRIDTSSTATSIPVTFNAGDYQELGYSDYIQVTVEACARGYAGDSKHVTRTYYISYPARATISGVDISSKDSAGKCTVRIATNSTNEHPVDRVRLEYLANVTYVEESDIPGDAEWKSTDIMDDAVCTALAMAVTELIPDRGKYTWIRVKSYHADEAVLHRYSNYVRISALETPAATAADDDIVILSATAGKDGQSAVVLLGWNKDGQDDSTGTELTWSEEEDAWKSTDDPDDHTFKWTDGPVTWEGVTYQDSAKITIKGLSEGAKYYIKARRYLEGDVTTYSEYSNTATVITSEKPETVVASCSRYVATGASLPVYWTFSGNGIQTEWQIVVTSEYPVYISTEDETPDPDKIYYTRSGEGTDEDPYIYSQVVSPVAADWRSYYEKIMSTGMILAGGEGSTGSTQINAERLAAFAQNGNLTFNVQASTGSGYVASEEHTVTILDMPELSTSIVSTLEQQPMTFTVTVSSLCDLTVIVTSMGAVGQFPQGQLRQTAGDTIFSDVLTPVWEEGNGGFTATVTLPDNLSFWDQGNYTVSIVAIDRITRLESEEIRAAFDVAWVNQAVSPEGFAQITPIDRTDDNGRHHQSVQIDLTPPTGSAATDVYDIYRITGDGARRIGESFPLTYTAIDEYAPFGENLTLFYRIALRTIDGDVEFTDIEYATGGDALRFDWEEGTLELPYNISIGDKYKKDVQTRKHMDGSIDGYWNDNIERTASLNSDLIRLVHEDEIALARQLARYSGPVFVRTPDGSAYEADVQVSDMSTEGTMETIAIDATEIGLTQEFILPTPFALEDEEG